MRNDAGINAQDYWNRRFDEDWEEFGGPQQSRFFAGLALENLPAWLFSAARRGRLSIADWGCAQGDGTQLLAAAVSSARVVGIDFAATAVAQARDRYPGLRFAVEDWLGEGSSGQREFDYVFSSNTLEHFHQPLEVLEKAAAHASKAVILAIPYREMQREREHFYSFLPQNIPASLANGFRLVWSKVVDCAPLPDAYWSGEQVFLVYADPAWLDTLGLVLEDCRIGTEPVPPPPELSPAVARRELEIEQLKSTVAARESELASAQRALDWHKEELQYLSLALSSGAEHAARLGAVIAGHDAQVNALAQRLSEQDRQANALLARLSEQDGMLQLVRAERDALAASVTSLEQQNRALSEEGEFRRQELARLSAWASGIAHKPLTYGIKRNSYLMARAVYRALPFAHAGKQKVKDALLRMKSGGSSQQPSRLAVAPSVQATPVPASSAPQRSELALVATTTAPTSTRRIVPHEGERDVVVFAVIDWHFRIQRPQHLARSLAQSGRRVFYVSNVFLDSSVPGYKIERLDPELELYQVTLHVPGAPAIYFAAPPESTIRRLQASLAEFIADFGMLSSVSLLQHPFWFPVVKTLPNSLMVYDCMDHHEGFGNVPEELVELEKDMLHESDLVVVTSSWLEEFAQGRNRNVCVVRNAGEYDFFARPATEVFRDDQGRRIIGYYGAIAEWFDVSLVRRIATERPDCLVLLVGSDTVKAARQLADLPNVQFTGEVPYKTLPYYLYAFDVCLLPFQVSNLTLATNPVKVYEYLASGKPVVCVDLPEIAQFDALVYKAASHDAFMACVEEALAENSVELRDRRRAFASEQTWKHRGAALSSALHALPLPKVSVIVLTFNNLELTRNCLESVVRDSDYPNLELVLVDNASTDGTPEYLRAFAERHAGARVILNEQNLGFSAGNNVGLAAATGDYLVILNNDTVVTRGWVLTMLRHLQRDGSVGLVGPVTNNIGNGARVDTTYARIEDMPNEAFSITLANMGAAFALSTAAFFCVMMSRAVYERVGPMSEEYGRGFFEDDDYCRRIEQAGLQVICAEDVFVHHHLSASFNKLPSAVRQALFDENKARYEAKWGAWVPHTYAREPRLARPVRRDRVRSAEGAAVEPEPEPSPCDPDDSGTCVALATAAIAVASERVEQPATVSPAPADDQLARRKFIHGRCPVCGKDSRFYYDERALWRETLNCEHCLSTSRYRSIARGVLRALGEVADVHARCMADLPVDPGRRRIAVYDTQPPFYYTPCAYPLPDMLKRTGWIDVHLSQYKPDMAAGAQISPGVTNQNLECLTYPSQSLDLLITSDVMEHVRLDEAAHREIHRVLRMGGVYVFTVPHDLTVEDTLVRVSTPVPGDPSRDEMLMEPEYHGDTNGDGSGVLAYRLYGRELLRSLERIGFDVLYLRQSLPHEGVLQTELFYCRKVRG